MSITWSGNTVLRSKVRRIRELQTSRPVTKRWWIPPWSPAQLFLWPPNRPVSIAAIFVYEQLSIISLDTIPSRDDSWKLRHSLEVKVESIKLTARVNRWEKKIWNRGYCKDFKRETSGIIFCRKKKPLDFCSQFIFIVMSINPKGFFKWHTLSNAIVRYPFGLHILMHNST